MPNAKKTLRRAGPARRNPESLNPPPFRRVDWHTYFMQIARQVSTRSTCDRRAVGAVIVRGKMILSTGYNGSIRGLPHCHEIGCDMENGHCVATIHAEANAILQSARNGVDIDESEIYTTASPCWHCFKLIANAGIRTIYSVDDYPDRRTPATARKAGIRMVRLRSPDLSPTR